MMVSAILSRIMAIEKMLRGVVLTGVFLLPLIVLIVSDALFFPYITGKNFTFRIIVEIITGAWLALALLNDAYRPRRSWMLYAFALFVFVMALADLFGINPGRSFMSNFERMEGWVTLAHLFAYFVVVISVLTTERLWKLLWHTSLGVSVIVGIYGLLQLAGKITINQGGVRLDATFGNATYLAIYMLFHIFMAIFLWVGARRDNPKDASLHGFFYGPVIALDALILFFTATRGTLIGLAVGGVVTLLLVALSSRRARASRLAGGAVALLLVSMGVFWLLRDTAVVQNVEPLQRLASISLTDNTIAARFINWSMAMKGVAERPILGWGQENYGIVFNKYYDPRMYAQEQWFDRTHNFIFDWLIAGGILGLLSYLSIFAAALYYLWRKGVFTPTERAILTGLIAGYVINNLVVFDNVTSYLLFAMLLGYIAYRGSEAEKAPSLVPRATLPRRAAPAVAALSVMAVWGVAYMVNADGLAQNRALLEAVRPQREGIAKNLEYFKKAVSYNSFGTQEAREHLVQNTSSIAGASTIPDDMKRQFLDLAVTEMKKQEALMPLEARFPLFLGVLYDAFGLYEQAAPELRRAHELSPAKQSILFELGMNALARNDTQEAVQAFKSAYELDTSFDDARSYYAAALIRTGNIALGTELIAPSVEKGIAPDQRVIAAYASAGKLEHLAVLWEKYVEKKPGDAQARFTLAAVYFAAKDKARSIATLERARRDFPQLASQIDGLIAQIKNGTATLQ